MADTIDEIISLYLDAVQMGKAAPVEQFLARFPDLSPATVAGLNRVLTLTARSADGASATAQHANWQRLAARLATDPLPDAGSPRPAPIYTRPAQQDRPVALRPARRLGGWAWGAGAALVVLLTVGWLLTHAPAGAGPTVAPADGPAAYGYRFNVLPVSADSNRLVISFTIAPPLDQVHYLTPLAWSTHNFQLITEDGIVLPPLDSVGWSVDSGGRFTPDPYEITMSFDTRAIHTTAALLPLHFTMNLFGTSQSRIGAPGRLPAIVPTAVGAMPIQTEVQFNQQLRVPFDARRRIVEPKLTSAAGGVTVTLDRVVVTASETRFYSHSTSDNALHIFPMQGNLTVHGDDWTMLQGRGGSSNRLPDGSYEVRIITELLDKPSPWTVSLPPVSPNGPDSLPQNPPVPAVGPWVFQFAMPPISTAASSVVAPTLPPGLSPTPLMPWGVPTYDAPRLPGAALTPVPTSTAP